MSLNSLAVATGIAALAVTDPTTSKQIKIYDVTAIPNQVNGTRDCPLLFPHPNTWQGGGNSEPSDGPATFGTPGARFWLFARKFQYVYLHAPVGAGRGLEDNYAAMSANVDALLTAITLLDLAAVDVKSIAVSAFGVIQDPASGRFYGCYVDVTLRERINP